jgi:peptidoglycan/xylan/chitin deacetylase (PgdA/CDA1 family)
MIVTTSWDDGHILDLKLADLLEHYELPGTFYISPHNREFALGQRLSAAQILALSQRFEIGAHTLTHPRLPRITETEAAGEITGSKQALEAIIGRPVTTFCYPGGAHTATNIRQVREAGYRYARLISRFSFEVGKNPLAAPTTVQAFRHFSDLGRIVRFARYNPFRALNYLLNWDKLAIALFNQAERTGGVFHLWGHSWEIDANGDWARLERVLQHISGHENARYVANGGLV